MEKELKLIHYRFSYSHNCCVTAYISNYVNSEYEFALDLDTDEAKDEITTKLESIDDCKSFLIFLGDVNKELQKICSKLNKEANNGTLLRRNAQ